MMKLIMRQVTTILWRLVEMSVFRYSVLSPSSVDSKQHLHYTSIEYMPGYYCTHHHNNKYTPIDLTRLLNYKANKTSPCACDKLIDCKVNILVYGKGKKSTSIKKQSPHKPTDIHKS